MIHDEVDICFFYFPLLPIPSAASLISPCLGILKDNKELLSRFIPHLLRLDPHVVGFREEYKSKISAIEKTPFMHHIFLDQKIYMHILTLYLNGLLGLQIH
jgi:hypothetical protein